MKERSRSERVIKLSQELLLKSCQEESGFTLIETLIAIGLFFFGTLAILAMSALAVVTLNTSKEVTTANTLAQERIEEVLTGSFEDATSEFFPSESEGSFGDHPEYSRFTLIEDGVPNAYMKQVTVTVSWSAISGQTTNKVVLRTILSRGEYTNKDDPNGSP